jgi:hypothetical protein
MNIGRIILALLVALSVGMLPASSIAGLSVQSPEAAGTSLTQDMPDCCPPKADPCAKGHGRLRSDGDLRAQVLQLRVASAVIVGLLTFFARMIFSFAGKSILVAAGQSAPFRPPRG